MTLNNFLDKTHSTHGDRPAMIFPGGQTTWRTVHEAVLRLAHGLQKIGVNKGERIAVMLPNVPHFAISFYAALRIGAVVVPVDVSLKPREVSWILEDSEARAFIVWDSQLPELYAELESLTTLKHVIALGEGSGPSTISLTRLIARSTPLTEPVEVEPDDSAVVEYTSGVTGTPKGANLSHGNIASNVIACCDIVKMNQSDTILAALPLSHPLAQTLAMHLAVYTGAAMNLVPKPDYPDIVKELHLGGVSLFPMLPSLVKALLDDETLADEEPERPTRLCVCGGGPLNEELLKAFEGRFHTYILECYFTAETSPVISFNRWRTGRRVSSLGHPIPGVDMRVVDESGKEVSIGEVGEIVVSGPNVMNGYINRPHASADALKDGWFHTGDLGKMDINGFFYLVDRLKHRINKAGFSIFPREVEQVLLGHPAVGEAAVVAIDDATYGQDIKACVVLKDGLEATTEQLLEYCRDRLALYKVPAVIRLYQDLPRDDAGRVRREELK